MEALQRSRMGTYGLTEFTAIVAAVIEVIGHGTNWHVVAAADAGTIQAPPEPSGFPAGHSNRRNIPQISWIRGDRLSMCKPSGLQGISAPCELTREFAGLRYRTELAEHVLEVLEPRQRP
jgi:hypothetical protein